ncbi:hypothetical protein VRB67_21100 [Pseudomonas trivialis]|uniref:hypothetical protein n=2 Tax=Pseudomonas trivialis TaxID=200450 RepID=UPI0030CCABCE
MMESVYIKETGIHPWDQLHPDADPEFTTMTLLNQNFSDVWNTWCDLSVLLTRKWPTILQWNTSMTPLSSKTQEYLMLKEFSKRSGPNDILKKNQTTSIYSEIVHLNSNPTNIDPTGLTTYRTSIIIMQNKNFEPENTWNKLSHLKNISTTENLKLILTDKDSICFRFYDMETHGAAQLICHSKNAKYAGNALSNVNATKINKNDIYAYIHRK